MGCCRVGIQGGFSQAANSLVDAFAPGRMSSTAAVFPFESHGIMKEQMINVEVAYARPEKQMIIPVRISEGQP